MLVLSFPRVVCNHNMVDFNSHSASNPNLRQLSQLLCLYSGKDPECGCRWRTSFKLQCTSSHLHYGFDLFRIRTVGRQLQYYAPGIGSTDEIECAAPRTPQWDQRNLGVEMFTFMHVARTHEQVN